MNRHYLIDSRAVGSAAKDLWRATLRAGGSPGVPGSPEAIRQALESATKTWGRASMLPVRGVLMMVLPNQEALLNHIADELTRVETSAALAPEPGGGVELETVVVGAANGLVEVHIDGFADYGLWLGLGLFSIAAIAVLAADYLSWSAAEKAQKLAANKRELVDRGGQIVDDAWAKSERLKESMMGWITGKR